jgi:hypothetical protein
MTTTREFELLMKLFHLQAEASMLLGDINHTITPLQIEMSVRKWQSTTAGDDQ